MESTTRLFYIAYNVCCMSQIIYCLNVHELLVQTFLRIAKCIDEQLLLELRYAYNFLSLFSRHVEVVALDLYRYVVLNL